MKGRVRYNLRFIDCPPRREYVRHTISALRAEVLSADLLTAFRDDPNKQCNEYVHVDLCSWSADLIVSVSIMQSRACLRVRVCLRFV